MDYAKLIWQQKDLEIMIGWDLQARSKGADNKSVEFHLKSISKKERDVAQLLLIRKTKTNEATKK